jgi:hypothetical protein
MKRNEYEQRKRILDDHLRTALDLVHAGHRAQVQMLEMLWRTSGGEVAEPPETPPLPEPLETPLPSSPPPKPRRAAHDLYFEVLRTLPRLPEDFTKHDVIRCLGDSPDRASLFRVLQTLREEGSIELKSEGSGKIPAVYHKKHNELS